MKSFKLFIESEELDEYESWDEYFDDVIYGLKKSEIKYMMNKFGVSFNVVANFVKFFDDNIEVWTTHDKTEDTFDVVAQSEDDMLDYVSNLDEVSLLEILGIEEEDMYIIGWERTIKEAQENPPIVYHHTTEEKWEEIKETGELRGSYGTGLTNRSSHGIFTTVDIEELIIGTYGDVQLAINLPEFKKSKELDKLELYPEPEVMEQALISSALYKLDLNSDYVEVSSDMSVFTMIVGHTIPLEFIQVEE